MVGGAERELGMGGGLVGRFGQGGGGGAGGGGEGFLVRGGVRGGGECGVLDRYWADSEMLCRC